MFRLIADVTYRDGTKDQIITHGTNIAFMYQQLVFEAGFPGGAIESIISILRKVGDDATLEDNLLRRKNGDSKPLG